MGYSDCPQGDLEEVQRLLKNEMMAVELACASREKAQAELKEVSLFLKYSKQGRWREDDQTHARHPFVLCPQVKTLYPKCQLFSNLSLALRNLRSRLTNSRFWRFSFKSNHLRTPCSSIADTRAHLTFFTIVITLSERSSLCLVQAFLQAVYIAPEMASFSKKLSSSFKVNDGINVEWKMMDPWRSFLWHLQC